MPDSRTERSEEPRKSRARSRSRSRSPERRRSRHEREDRRDDERIDRSHRSHRERDTDRHRDREHREREHGRDSERRHRHSRDDRDKDEDKEERRHRDRSSRDKDKSSSSHSSRRRDEEASHSERRRHRRDRHSDSDSSSDSERESKEERRERRRRRKEKKERKAAKKKTAAVTEWGKHGIINESDVISRLQGEFHEWLRHERVLNPETLSKAVERKEMTTFIEDYNTATLPSEKYYDLEKYERRMELIRQGETLPDDSTYDARADEAAAKASFRARAAQAAASNPRATSSTSHLSQQQLEDLARVSRERIEAAKMKVLGIETSKNLGVRMDARLPGTR